MVDSQTLISAAIAVAALHILISFIFFLAAMSNLGDGKMADKERKSFVLTSGIFWLISLFACITILVLLTYIKPKQETTPCPIQLSQPGDQNRGEIEDFINDVKTNVVGDLPAFDSSLTYLVVTGFYKNHLLPPTTSEPDGKNNVSIGDRDDQRLRFDRDDRKITLIPESMKNMFTSLLNKYGVVPIGFIKDDIIYGLGGKPVFDIQ